MVSQIRVHMTASNLVFVWTTYLTASAHHGCGSCAQCRHTLVLSETTPVLRSTIPFSSELSAVMCSWLMLCLSRTCSNACELKSGPPSVRTNWIACSHLRPSDFALKVVDNLRAFGRRFQKVHPCESCILVDDEDEVFESLRRSN